MQIVSYPRSGVNWLMNNYPDLFEKYLKRYEE